MSSTVVHIGSAVKTARRALVTILLVVAFLSCRKVVGGRREQDYPYQTVMFQGNGPVRANDQSNSSSGTHGTVTFRTPDMIIDA